MTTALIIAAFGMICAWAGVLILCRTMDHDNDDYL
jgi:hypothetical protein